jgi:hypothetical protein
MSKLAADIDGDGDMDVLAVPSTRSGQYSSVPNAMYINDGGGALQKLMEGTFVTDGAMYNGNDVKAVDIDGDGDLDVLVGNGNGNHAIYITNSGSELQRLTESVFVTDGGLASDLEVVDIDGDGNLDVFVANKHNSGIAVYTNFIRFTGGDDGGGRTFQKLTEGAFVTYDINADGADSNKIAAADIDGDGDVDILVANGGGHNNAIYINDGGRGDLFRKLTEGIFVTDGIAHGESVIADC